MFKEKFLKKGNNLYFIAEIGINHNGNFELAKKMIKLSKDAGADAVKFQKRHIKSLLHPSLKVEKSQGYLSKHENDIPQTKKQFGSWVYPDSRLELNNNQIIDLWKYSNKLKLDFIVSPWEENSVDFLKKNKAKVIKLASIDANNFLFCEYIARKKIPTIISTGMCTYNDILNTKKIFDEFNCPSMFLHCASSYPTDLKDKNLNCIKVLNDLLKTDIGFSGHGIGFEGTIGSIILGSRVIEKHVTLNKEMAGPDHAASLNFDELKTLIRTSYRYLQTLGSNNKEFLLSETVLNDVLGKRIYLNRSLKKGSIIKKTFLSTAVIKKNIGFKPNQVTSLLNKKVVKNLKKNHIIENKDINFD
jgi:sialic acid synthase SpsE